MKIEGWLLRAYDGKEHGPVSLSTLRRWISERRADGDSLVLAPGESTWKPLKEFPELASCLQADISGLIEKNKRLEEELRDKSQLLEMEREEKISLEEKLKEKEALLKERLEEPPVLKEEFSQKLASLEQGLGEKDIFSHHLKMILTLYDIIKQTERDIVSELQSLLTQIKMEKLKQISNLPGERLISERLLPPEPPPLEEPVVLTRPAALAAPLSNKEDSLTNIFLLISLFLMIGLLGYILAKYFVL